ncbi:MAG: C4-type zinc ribbon domain-containing protein [Gemmatimonadota bacterium]
MDNLKEGLLQLLKVQEVDKEIDSLEQAKSKYPEEIDRRQAEIDQVEARLGELAGQLADTEKRQRHLERELEAAREQLKKLEARFSEVTTNKEYDALQLEVEACKARMSEHETQILALIESAEALRQQVEMERQDVAQVREEQQTRIDELRTKLGSLEEEASGVLARRQGVVLTVDPALLQTYDRSRNARGRRVAAIRKGACGACFRQLPAQQRSNVRRAEAIQRCESCGAILVWDQESS